MRIAIVTFDGFNELDSFIAQAPRTPALMVEEAGLKVLDQSFVAHGNVAPVGQKQEYVQRATAVLKQYL